MSGMTRTTIVIALVLGSLVACSSSTSDTPSSDSKSDGISARFVRPICVFAVTLMPASRRLRRAAIAEA